MIKNKIIPLQQNALVETSMKKIFITMFIICMIIFFNIFSPIMVFAQDDNDGWNVRPTYSLQEVNEGKLGDKITFNSIVIKDSDYEWYKNTHDGKSIPTGTLRNETNFVGARENTGVNQGDKNVWEGDEIKVEDGKSYIVRLYVHNNSPKGTDAIARDTSVRFFVPGGSAKEQVVNGWLNSSNASPNQYLDDVTFKSDNGVPFHLEYVYGSALLENGGIASGDGIILSDNIIDDGVQIGYDALDGNVPGCYEYTNYVTIEVKAVYDYEYTVETKVRLADNEDKTWQDVVEADVGDRVEFLIQYCNIGTATQREVRLKDTLPNHLRYVAGSTKIMNSNYPNGAKINEDYIVTDGIKIGNYAPNANAFIMFTAEVIDEGLAEGANTLVNWGHIGVGSSYKQDYASVVLYKNTVHKKIVTMLYAIIAALIIAIIFLSYKIYHERRKLGLPRHKWRNKK